MTNKYLTKIASSTPLPEEKSVDVGRMVGRAGLYGMGANVLARKGLGMGPVGTVISSALGAHLGATTSIKNQRKEDSLHNAKIRGANRQQELHDFKMEAMKKQADEKVDPNQGKKDLINTGVIAGLGGVGTMAVDKALPAAQRLMPKIRRGALVGGLGVGVGLAADYAGLKLNHQINKQIDKK